MSTSNETNKPTPKLAAEQKRILDAIFRISEKLPAQFRAYVDAYYRFVSPSMSWTWDQHFPTALRRHPQDTDHTTMEQKENILYFHIGNAIVTYYEALNDVPGGINLPRRIALLEQIAKVGYSTMVVQGDDRTGYYLLPRDEVRVKFLAPGGINEDGRTEKM
jgi:hypothetical protein